MSRRLLVYPCTSVGASLARDSAAHDSVTSPTNLKVWQIRPLLFLMYRNYQTSGTDAIWSLVGGSQVKFECNWSADLAIGAPNVRNFGPR